MAAAGIARRSKTGASAAFPITSEHIEEVITRKIEAARKIQAAWRFHKARPYIDACIVDPEKFKKLPTPNRGTTPVRFLGNGVVLKACDQYEPGICQARISKMNQARKLCQTNGFNHLVVPKGEEYHGFLIEERLPIPLHIFNKEQIGIYVDNTAAFDEAVTQFMHFNCLSRFTDLIADDEDCECDIIDIARRDNLPMFLTKEGIGKIGLIDLEHFSVPEEPLTEEEFLEKCLTAIRFFPLHFDTIIAVAKKYDPAIEEHMDELIAEQKETLTFFENVYLQHKRYCQEKQITTENPSRPIQIREERKAIIIANMTRAILRDYTRWVKGQYEITPEKLNQFLPQFVNAATDFINILLNGNINDHGGPEEIKTDSKLLSARSLYFNEAIFRTLLAPKISDQIISIFNIVVEQANFSRNLLLIFLRELTGNEINYFYPSKTYVSSFNCAIYERNYLILC